jgi:ATP-binding cassette subfamily C protein CydCD
MLNKSLFNKAHTGHRYLWFAILCGWLGGVLVVVQAALLSRIVFRVFLEHAGRQAVWESMLWLLGVILLRGISVWISEISANQAAVRVKTDIRQTLFRQLLRLGPGYTRGQRAGELTNTLLEGVEALDAYFREYLPQLAQAVVIPLTVLIFVFPVDLISGLIFLVTAPLIPLFMSLIGSLADRQSRRQWQSQSRISAYFYDVLRGLSTLKLSGQSRAQIQIITRLSEQFREATMRVLRVAFLSALVLELLTTLSTALIAVGVGLRLLHGQVDFQSAFFILLLAPEFYLPLRLLGSRFHAGVSGLSAAERILHILDLQPEIEVSCPTPAPDVCPNHPPEIRLEGIAYRYPGETRSALLNLNLHIPSAARVAIVGPTGSGKSTLAALLLGLIRPTQGRILIDGRQCESLNSSEWRARVAWLPQTPYLFNDTVAANLRLAKPAASLPELRTASRLARADEFILNLPQGYQTILGEMEVQLSGGQAHRLALGRALLKDASLLVLDEPTAHLDPLLETDLSAALDAHASGRTVVTIAHRLATVTRADFIIVLSDGQVIQTGTHQELMAQPGLYRQMVQAGGFLDTAKCFGDEPAEALPLRLEATTPATRVKTRPPAKIPTRKLIQQLAGFLRAEIGQVVLAVLLGAATVLSGIGLMTTSAYLIARAALLPTIAEIQVAVVGVRFFGLARGVFRYLERLVTHQTTFRLLSRLRVWFYRQLEPLAPAGLEKQHSADLFGRMLADINQLESFFVRGVAPPLVALTVALILLPIFGQAHRSLSLILLIFLLLGGIGIPWLARRLSLSAGAAWIASRALLYRALGEAVHGLAELLVYNQGDTFLKRLQRLSASTFSAQSRLAGINGLTGGLMVWLNLGCMWSILFVSIPLVEAGIFDGITLAVILLASLASFEAIQNLPQAASALESSLQSASRLMEVLETPPPVSEPEKPAPLPDTFDLQVKRLTFRYPGVEIPVLQEISFRFTEGESLAIVGPSGAGKTTLLRLLYRFWQAPPGSIYLGGKDLRLYASADVRRLFAVLPQRVYLFNASLRENLTIARPRATQAELEWACAQAQLLPFIQGLPDGFDTQLGESGIRLSGGERQRLAIARTLLQDAPVLILDEPISGLDTITEASLWDTLRALIAGRTTLLVTHRLMNLDWVDRILVLDQGRLVESGDHRELLRAGGLYTQMYAAQQPAVSISLSRG